MYTNPPRQCSEPSTSPLPLNLRALGISVAVDHSHAAGIILLPFLELPFSSSLSFSHQFSFYFIFYSALLSTVIPCQNHTPFCPNPCRIYIQFSTDDSTVTANRLAASLAISSLFDIYSEL